MKIIVPLSGRDQRFIDAFGVPKPLVQVGGMPIIKRCMDLLPFPIERTIFICLKEEQENFQIADKLKEMFGNVEVVLLDAPTEGAACTVLTQKEKINNDEELFIFLADIYFKADLKTAFLNRGEAAGIIPVFPSDNKKYSYTRTDERGRVLEVAEKTVISNNASAGAYYFAHGKDFIWATEEMITKNRRVNNWFYICPVYQELVERGDFVKILPVEFVTGLGSPEEVKAFEKTL